MNRVRKHQAFSLTEVLIAVGIMAIGLVMVAMVFPVGIKLTALTTERTIGAVAVDEAFAKIQLYGLRNFELSDGTNNWPVSDPNEACSDYQYVTAFAGPDGVLDNGDETVTSYGPDTIFGTGDDVYLAQYPSTPATAGEPGHYHWSALCRRVGAKDVQVTVFVTRKIAAASKYRAWDPDNPVPPIIDSPWPKPIPVNVDYDSAQPKELVIKDNPAFPASESRYFFDDGYTIVDNLTGTIYRVLEIKDADGDNLPDTLVLMEPWQWVGYPLLPVTNETDRTIWVVPPAVGSGRYPAVGVYQKVLRFDTIQ